MCRVGVLTRGQLDHLLLPWSQDHAAHTLGKSQGICIVATIRWWHVLWQVLCWGNSAIGQHPVASMRATAITLRLTIFLKLSAHVGLLLLLLPRLAKC